MYTAEDGRAHGPYTVVYTGGVYRPCARPAHGRVPGRGQAVRPLYTAAYMARTFTRPIHGNLHGRVTGVPMGSIPTVVMIHSGR